MHVLGGPDTSALLCRSRGNTAWSLALATPAPEVQAHKVNSGVDTWVLDGPQVSQCNVLKINSASFLPSSPCCFLGVPSQPPFPATPARRLDMTADSSSSPLNPTSNG